MAERLNFRQACQQAGVSRQRLNQAIASGRLPAERGGGPGKPTYINREDLQAWCVSEGLAMPLEALERSERLQSEDLTMFLHTVQPIMAAIERLEHRIEDALERLERSQTEAIAQGIRDAFEGLGASAPVTRGGTSTEGPQAPRVDRAGIIARIRRAKDRDGHSYQQIADTLNAEGIPTFSGKGIWQKGNVERFTSANRTEEVRPVDQGGARFLEYLHEYITRFEAEEPTCMADIRDFFGLSDEEPLQTAVMPGGMLGMIIGFIDWLQARYPHEVEPALQPYYRKFRVVDAAALRVKLQHQIDRILESEPDGDREEPC